MSPRGAHLAVRIPATSGDALPLKRALRRANARRRTAAVLLTLPLLLFLVLGFVMPIAAMLAESVKNREVLDGLPRTVKALGGWSGADLPDEAAYAALVADLKTGYGSGALPRAAIRLNYELSGYRSLLMVTARRVATSAPHPAKPALLQLDGRWGQREYWAAIRRNAAPYTSHYLLAAVDLTRDADSRIVPVPSAQAIFRQIFVRTMAIGLTVTLACLVLGFPVAYVLATVPARVGNVLMIFVLLPLWTSLLVRTTAWVVLLQQHGLLNDALVGLGLLAERVSLIFNRTGLVIAMTHVLLPFMILPLYSVMKGIDPRHVKAALSLGARPAWAFWTVYLPQTMPGVGSGCLLVFILAIGYYITPELIGGGADQMVSHFVAVYTNEIVNWGQASALGAVLLAVVLVLYAFYHRVFGVDHMRLG
jgi:putative spermidine/putrescine transport system permease protein